MAEKKKVAPATITVVRSKRGRKEGPGETKRERFAALDNLFADKALRVTVEVKESDAPDAPIVESYPAIPLVASTIGAPAEYTGMPGLVGDWAKARGHKVTYLASNGLLRIR